MKGNWCFRLWQENEGDIPVAIVFIRYNERGQITNILLGKNKSFMKTYATGCPSGVETKEYPAVNSLLHQAFGEEDTLAVMRKKDVPVADEEGVYVWQKSDQYIRDWFQNNSY